MLLAELPDGAATHYSPASQSLGFSPCASPFSARLAAPALAGDFTDDHDPALAEGGDTCDVEERLTDELELMVDVITHEATAEIIGGEDPTRSCGAAIDACEDIPGASWHASKQAECAEPNALAVCSHLNHCA